MKKHLYIGEFPPPIGGVTVKNNLMRTQVFYDCDIEFFDLYRCKRNSLTILVLVSKIVRVRGSIVLGIGSNVRLKTLLQMIKLLRGTRMLGRCSIVMMGSTLQNYTRSDTKAADLVRKSNSIFTESLSINEEFAQQNIVHTQFFPNCRVLPSKEYCGKRIDYERGLKLVFFSKVCKEKGAHVLFEVLAKLDEIGIPVQLDYYGVIAPEYQKEFEESLRQLDHVSYKGVFDSQMEDVYEKLSEYDILLFPTAWKGEGVPGILVESKIAGIPAIVTRHNYNSEIVVDTKEGIVVDKENMVENYVAAILELYNNPDHYADLARGAWESRVRYDIACYKDRLISIL